jgi:hypothetical protein
VTFDDWMLALHVLSAFALVGGTVVFWVLIVALRSIDTPEAAIGTTPLSIVGAVATGIGAVGTILLGVVLAVSVGDYHPWDGWIVAAIVLWVVAMGLGSRTNAAYEPALSRAKELQQEGATGPSPELLALNRTSRGLLLHALASVVVLLILVDMIWKPGA